MTHQQIPETAAPGRRLGRHVNHDPRSLQFLVEPAAAKLRSVTHERVIPVLDQGDLGSCTGNAATGALGTQPLYDALPADDRSDLDEGFAVLVYERATDIDPFPGSYPPDDTGSDGLSVAKVLKAYGLISRYRHATSLRAMQTALQTTPVIVGVHWYTGFDTPDGDGVVKLGGELRGGHEFEVIGVDFERKRFEAVNSWGDGWGVAGHFFITFDDMRHLLSERGDCTQLLPL
jgi:hypothetical protein